MLTVDELHGHGLAALAYESKPYEICSVEFLVRYTKICINKTFPDNTGDAPRDSLTTKSKQGA